MSLDKKHLIKKYNFNKSIKDIILQEGDVIDALSIKDIELLAAKCYARENYIIKKNMTEMNKVQIFDVFKSRQLIDYSEKELDNLAYAIKYNFNEDLIANYLTFLIENEYFPNRTYFDTPINTSIVLNFIDKFNDNQFLLRNGIDLKIKEKSENTSKEEMAPKEMYDVWIKTKSKELYFHLTKNKELYIIPKLNFDILNSSIIDEDKIVFSDIVSSYLVEFKYEKVNNFTYKCNNDIDYFQLYFEFISRGFETNYVYSKYIMINFENYK